MTFPRKETAFHFGWHPFVRKIVLQLREPGRYMYFENWRFTKRVRRMCVWDGSAWVDVPDNVIDADPKHISLLRSYSDLLGINFDMYAGTQTTTKGDNQ